MNLSPYELHILLDVYVGGRISTDKSAAIYEGTIEAFIDRELILPYFDEDIRPHDEAEFMPTEKLKVMMHAILSTPDPVWRMPA